MDITIHLKRFCFSNWIFLYFSLAKQLHYRKMNTLPDKKKTITYTNYVKKNDIIIIKKGRGFIDKRTDSIYSIDPDMLRTCLYPGAVLVQRRAQPPHAELLHAWDPNIHLDPSERDHDGKRPGIFPHNIYVPHGDGLHHSLRRRVVHS